MAYDLIVVGGGIGGSALAATMAGAGWSVLLLEKSAEYEDRVRGEWISPWGVAETQRLGLYDLLKGAGGHHLTSHVTYDESIPPELAEEAVMPLALLPGVPGPLCIRHPVHCQTLFDEAGRRGAEALRPVKVTGIELGASPSVTYEHDGRTITASAPLVVGAEGRQSKVRKAAGIALNQDKPHHWFAGLLVDDVHGIDETRQSIGTEGDFGFLAFPQGGSRVRVYGGYALDEMKRFAAKDGTKKFLESFRFRSAPANDAIAEGTPAGPLFSYYNNDSWTDEPFAEGAVLIGDAAGWNDPINGLGLSITYRDVRIVSDLLKDAGAGQVPDFRPFAEERAERMRRLRFAGQLQASLDMEFGEEAKARRLSYHQRRAADPEVGMHGIAIMAGPESVPEDFYTETHRNRVLGRAS
ncbi:monooxygenase [Pacificimonas flava]|uniref:Monooxygenase n=2 Tax=Pacificimonas TaxID=1960290 RepID=A0A219B2A6_9SPHN|nr:MULTISPECIES: NAD(P)/FAD-dependent oxidoreductase [Pacificimonas]MBZ6377845.1 FAD-dependent monooxygenase [Pacificimonas aurantium]OWV32492.1 monooxygenase [Pacificimonas flava]